ncbi:hypothetical protein HDU93_002803, partial [Gonapodya sp. JEL0774]
FSLTDVSSNGTTLNSSTFIHRTTVPLEDGDAVSFKTRSVDGRDEYLSVVFTLKGGEGKGPSTPAPPPSTATTVDPPLPPPAPPAALSGPPPSTSSFPSTPGPSKLASDPHLVSQLDTFTSTFTSTSNTTTSTTTKSTTVPSTPAGTAKATIAQTKGRTPGTVSKLPRAVPRAAAGAADTTGAGPAGEGGVKKLDFGAGAGGEAHGEPRGTKEHETGDGGQFGVDQTGSRSGSGSGGDVRVPATSLNLPSDGETGTVAVEAPVLAPPAPTLHPDLLATANQTRTPARKSVKFGPVLSPEACEERAESRWRRRPEVVPISYGEAISSGISTEWIVHHCPRPRPAPSPTQLFDKDHPTSTPVKRGRAPHPATPGAGSRGSSGSAGSVGPADPTAGLMMTPQKPLLKRRIVGETTGEGSVRAGDSEGSGSVVTASADVLEATTTADALGPGTTTPTAGALADADDLMMEEPSVPLVASRAGSESSVGASGSECGVSSEGRERARSKSPGPGGSGAQTAAKSPLQKVVAWLGFGWSKRSGEKGAKNGEGSRDDDGEEKEEEDVAGEATKEAQGEQAVVAGPSGSQEWEMAGNSGGDQ